MKKMMMILAATTLYVSAMTAQAHKSEKVAETKAVVKTVKGETKTNMETPPKIEASTIDASAPVAASDVSANTKY